MENFFHEISKIFIFVSWLKFNVWLVNGDWILGDQQQTFFGTEYYWNEALPVSGPVHYTLTLSALSRAAACVPRGRFCSKRNVDTWSTTLYRHPAEIAVITRSAWITRMNRSSAFTNISNSAGVIGFVKFQILRKLIVEVITRAQPEICMLHGLCKGFAQFSSLPWHDDRSCPNRSSNHLRGFFYQLLHVYWHRQEETRRNTFHFEYESISDAVRKAFTIISTQAESSHNFIVA